MKTVTHIIFIAYQPLTKKFEEDFYLKRIMEEGFKAEYWNVSAIYHKNLTIHDTVNKSFVKELFSFDQLEQEVKKYKDCSLFIFHINYYASVYKLFRVFSKHKCQTAFFARGMLPFPLLKKGLFEKTIKKIISGKKIYTLKNLILNRLAAWAKYMGLIKPFSLVFEAGFEGIYSVGYGSNIERKRSKLISVNAPDYDKYLLLKNSNTRIIDYRYCVFLDEFLPYHPDFDILKIAKVNAEDYYNSLNSFFDKIESTHNIKVIIAAHPKSDYSNKSSFLNRCVIKYKTFELVKDCEFVMAHISTSISFAVLFKKPVLFLYNNAIIKTYPDRHYPHILHFARTLNAQSLNIDSTFEKKLVTQIKEIDLDRYDQYKYNYLTSVKSEKNITEEIFFSYLKTLDDADN